MMELNDPVVLADVTAACDLYEDALVHNKVDVLDALFWNSPHTLRYGATENLYGYAEIMAFRASRPSVGLARDVVRREIVSYGKDFATCNLEFTRAGNPKIGRQSQTWARTDDGWKVVSAHVSLMA